MFQWLVHLTVHTVLAKSIKVQTTLLGPGWMTSPTFVNIASLILAFSWETAAAWQQMAAVAVPCTYDDLQVYTAVQGASETVEGLLFGTPCIAQFQRKLTQRRRNDAKSTFYVSTLN